MNSRVPYDSIRACVRTSKKGTHGEIAYNLTRWVEWLRQVEIWQYRRALCRYLEGSQEHFKALFLDSKSFLECLHVGFLIFGSRG